MKNNIIACGIPRTGSTLVWQILSRALPMYNIIKAHPASWTPCDCELIVGSIRHPYDNAASCFRSRVIGDNGDGIHVEGTKKGLRAELNMLTNNYKVLRKLKDRYGDKMVILRYEDFFNNFEVIFNIIEEKTSEIIPFRRREDIIKDCSFKTNLKRSITDIRGKEYKQTKINPGHVGVGIPGTWKTVIPRWGYSIMKKWCDPLCKEWKYENQ